MKKRVRGIIIKNGQIVAIERERNGNIFWALPGGGVESYDIDDVSALTRECLEEVNLNVKIIKLIWSREFNGSIEDFYLCKIVGGEIGPGSGPEYIDGNQEYSGQHLPSWLPLDSLQDYDLKPTEIRDMIIKNKNYYDQ